MKRRIIYDNKERGMLTIDKTITEISRNNYEFRSSDDSGKVNKSTIKLPDIAVEALNS